MSDRQDRGRDRTPKNEVIRFRIEADEKRRIADQAQANGETVSDFVRSLCMEAVGRRIQREKEHSHTASAWQPMDTAPKDGTWILVLCNGLPFVANWLKWQANGKEHSAWCLSNHEDFIMPHEPTHWASIVAPDGELALWVMPKFVDK